jgi:hypothetical protein
MKVIPDSTGASALDTWLRAADPDYVHERTARDGVSQDYGTQVAAASVAAGDAIAQPRDTAEDLLALDVWNGDAPERLSSGASSPAPANASVQQWAEHIFSPLR